jgi:hypothetical protein
MDCVQRLTYDPLVMENLIIFLQKCLVHVVWAKRTAACETQQRWRAYARHHFPPKKKKLCSCDLQGAIAIAAKAPSILSLVESIALVAKVLTGQSKE